MKILLILLGFLAALGVVAVVIFIAVALFKNRAGGNTTTTTTTVPAPTKKTSFAWLGWVVAIVLVVIGANLGYRYYKNAIQPPAPKSPIAAPAAVAPEWQLCWEKIPGHTGTTNTRQLCLPAQILRDNASLVLTYPYGDGRGTMEAKSGDGTVYDGLWKDPGGWGNVHLRFTSPTSAVGWVDEKGEKPINLWIFPSK